MKIVYLLGSLNRGGTETLMLDFLSFCKNDTRIKPVLIYRKGGVLEPEFMKTKAKLIRLGINNPLFIIAYLLKLRKLLQNEKVQIVHAQQVVDAFFAFFALKGTGIKIVLSFHGYDFNYNYILSKITRFIIKHTAVNVFVSKSQSHYYKEKYCLKDEQVQVVYNGILFDKLNCNNTTTNIRSELNIMADTVLLGMVGSFVAVRDQFTICEFLKLLNEANIDFRFLFVGKESALEPWRMKQCVDFCRDNGLTDKVYFLGQREDVPQILTDLDAFVYATDHDTFGIAVIEAIAAGIPVFVNDWSVMCEITQYGKLATIYTTKNVASLLNQFELFLSDQEGYKKYAKFCAQEVKKLYNIENYVNNLYVLYSLLLVN